MDPFKSVLQVVCCPQETLASLKYRIIDNDFAYKCIFDNKELDDNFKLLTDYGIKEGSTIRLTWDRSRVRLRIRDPKTFHLNNP